MRNTYTWLSVAVVYTRCLSILSVLVGFGGLMSSLDQIQGIVTWVAYLFTVPLMFVALSDAIKLAMSIESSLSRGADDDE